MLESLGALLREEQIQAATFHLAVPDRNIVVFNQVGSVSFTVLHFWHCKK